MCGILLMHGNLWGGRKWANGSASDSCLTCLASQWDGFHCRCNKAILAVGVLVQFNIFSHFQSEIKGAWQWEPLRTRDVLWYVHPSSVKLTRVSWFLGFQDHLIKAAPTSSSQEECGTWTWTRVGRQLLNFRFSPQTRT